MHHLGGTYIYIFDSVCVYVFVFLFIRKLRSGGGSGAVPAVRKCFKVDVIGSVGCSFLSSLS